MSTLIGGLNQLLTTNAVSFVVTKEDLLSHKRTWEKEPSSKKLNVTSRSELALPLKWVSEILVEFTIRGLYHLPLYDIDVLCDLMNVKQSSRYKIPLSWLKDSVILLQDNKNAKQNIKEMVEFYEKCGWDSSYIDEYTCGMVAFMWRSLNEAF